MAMDHATHQPPAPTLPDTTALRPGSQERKTKNRSAK
jgi:hypothetical protein